MKWGLRKEIRLTMRHTPVNAQALDPRTLDTMRDFLKFFNPFMILHWHLGLGKLVNIWPSAMGRFMVIVHTGRKTGKRRCTPVNYAEVDGEIYCTAGFGNGSDWYRNIKAHPEVDIWLPDGWWCAVTEDITDSPGKLRLLRQVFIGSGFVAPLIGLDPKTINDDQLRVVTEDYQLIHIRRIAARTGSGGPGQWAWIWPLSSLLLTLLVLRPRRTPNRG